jgi:CRP-like cAMP-binding protein
VSFGEALRRLARDEIERVLEDHAGLSVRARDRQMIFHRMDAMDSIFVLARGRIRCFVGDEDETTTLLLEAPAVFGDRDLLEGVVSQESAQALEPSTVCLWSRAAFTAAWRDDQDLRAWLGRDLRARYVSALSLLEVARKPLTARLLGFLREEELRGARALPARSWLARLCGTTERSVRRALLDLQAGGALAVGADRFAVDVDALERAGLDREPHLYHRLVVGP